DDARVDRVRLAAADAQGLALLQRAQELHLDVRRDLGDLVEEERAAVGALEAAGARRDGAREGALLVAEELALEDTLGEGLHVDGDERAADALAPVVEQAGDQLLPRPALALDQHRGAARRHAADERQELPAPRALGDHRLGRVTARHLLAEPAVLALEAPHLERARDRGAQLVVVERLGDVVERALAHGRDRRGGGALRGDAVHGRARAGPRPGPRGRVGKRGSQMRARSSGGTPGPESATAISTPPSAAAAASATSPPLGAASAALASSPRSTWQMRSPSARTSGSSGDSSRRTRNALPWSSSCARRSARSKSSCTDTDRASTRSGRAKARSELATFPRRANSVGTREYARRLPAFSRGTDSASPCAAERM